MPINCNIPVFKRDHRYGLACTQPIGGAFAILQNVGIYPVYYRATAKLFVICSTSPVIHGVSVEQPFAMSWSTDGCGKRCTGNCSK